MSNGIRLRQNEEHSIEMLAAQRQLYNDVKRYDWYTPSVDEKELNEGILSCQRENVWWDVGLRKKIRMGSIIAIVTLCIAVFVRMKVQ